MVPSGDRPVSRLQGALPPSIPGNIALADFELGELLGEGSYARVVAAKLKTTGVKYALKIVDKAHVLKCNKQSYVMNEKAVMSMLDHPGVIHLYATFQDNYSLYFVLEFASGGELFQQIKALGKCPVDVTQFYCAEIIVILQYIQTYNVIHRDLKPENLLLSHDGHIKLTDFGSVKMADQVPSTSDPHPRRNSFAGTAEYVAPEVLNNQDVGFESDLWSLGCVLFQCLCGRLPFQGETEYLTFQQISHRSFRFENDDDFPETAKSLINRLLSMDPKERIGDGFDSLKAHPFFDGITFHNIFKSTSPALRLLRRSSKDLLAGDGKENIAAHCSAYLKAGEKVIFSSLISKRRGMFSRKRLFVLTSVPRILYFDPNGANLRGEIPFAQIVRFESRNATLFCIHTVDKVLQIQAIGTTSTDWVDALNQAKEIYAISRSQYR